MVSIIPGIENFAPLRTETKRRLELSTLNDLSVFLSNLETASKISSFKKESKKSGFSRNLIQLSVVMVKPGGTGNPKLLISAKLAPFPPRSALSFALPSSKE